MASENEHAMTMPMQRLLRSPAAEFGEHVLRDVGQVMLQNNLASGLLFLIGIFIGNWQSGLYALFGMAVATATAMMKGAPSRSVSSGLYGLNGTLAGLGLATFLNHDVTLLVYVAIAAVSVTVVAVLTAMALGGVFFVLHPATVVLSAIAVCFSTILSSMAARQPSWVRSACRR
jgi:urea transporter